MNRSIRALAVAGDLLASAALQAHSSVDEVVSDLRARDPYIEVVDRAPPPFALRDAEGRPVALDDFAGRVVVLNFIYARCREACPLHSNLLARVQQLLREARLAERYGLQFTAGPDGDQMHGVVTHVIDAQGRMRARFHGLRFAPESLLLYVAALANAGPGHAHAAAAAPAAPAFVRGLWLAVALGAAGLAVALVVARRRRARPPHGR